MPGSTGKFFKLRHYPAVADPLEFVRSTGGTAHPLHERDRRPRRARRDALSLASWWLSNRHIGILLGKTMSYGALSKLMILLAMLSGRLSIFSTTTDREFIVIRPVNTRAPPHRDITKCTPKGALPRPIDQFLSP